MDIPRTGLAQHSALLAGTALALLEGWLGNWLWSWSSEWDCGSSDGEEGDGNEGGELHFGDCTVRFCGNLVIGGFDLWLVGVYCGCLALLGDDL